jgi:hypothetical protein
MPPEVGERRHRSRQRSIVVLLLALFVLALAAGYVGISMLTASAVSDAQAAENRSTELQAQISALSEVDQVQQQILNADSARQYAAAVETFWPLLYSSVNGLLPEGSTIQIFDVTMTPFGTSPASPTGPFDITGVGSIAFTAEVPFYVDAASFEDQLNTVPGFERARVSTVTVAAATVGAESAAVSGEGEAPDDSAATEGAPTDTYVLNATVVITYDALMMRYSPRWFGTDDESLESLEAYYVNFYEALLAGEGVPDGYPPLPVVTPPPFVPGQLAVAPVAGEPTPAPTVSPAPATEATP